MSDMPEHHGLFIYDNDDDFVDRIASYLGPGTEDGEAGMAVVGERKWELLCGALGDCSQRIHRFDPEAIYTRPLATLAEYDALAKRAIEEGAAAVHLIGELPACKSQSECDMWTAYEAVLNRAFDDMPIYLVCGYDVREHHAEAVEAAQRTHARALVEGWEDNLRYRDPADVVTGLRRHPQPLTSLRELPIDDDVTAFGARLSRELATLGLDAARAERLLLAAREVFENARTHGRGPRSQRIGPVAELVAWELSDNGPGIRDPLVGYLPPQQQSAVHKGLWLVRRLTLDVELLDSDMGFTVRLWV
jgi:anti-sigma regulatory factor (Ser/Thr protein kinase)